MTLSELIETLTDLQREHGDQVPVRLAHQPNWPFELSISAVEAVNVAGPDEDDRDVARDILADPESVVVYIAEGSQIGYLPGVASQALGWR